MRPEPFAEARAIAVITIFEAGKTLKALGLEGLFIICRALELFLMAAKSGQGNRSAFYFSAAREGLEIEASVLLISSLANIVYFL